MPTNHDETLAERYMRELQTELAIYSRMTPEQIGAMAVDLHNALAERDAALAELAEWAPLMQCLGDENQRLRDELAALKAQDTVGEVVGWYRLDRPYEMTSYPSVCATWHKLGAPVAPLYTAPPAQASAWVPEGWKLVPERMHLDSSVIETIQAHCGDGQEDAGFGPYSDGVLWIGECEEEDGSKTYGLHIATADYPEEGSSTLVEFAAAPTPGASDGKGGGV